ncbi:MAG TPA: MBL fold metallo-hydrolase [Oscillospiraceae bacterium]|nr:MBL fold metallo-hydrolase [Oscillospiraceae bacterium]
MQLCTLASGSEGNAALLIAPGALVLLDAGISARRIVRALRALGRSPEELDALVLTHAHSDHISGADTLTRHYDLPVFATEGTALSLLRRAPAARETLHIVEPGTAFNIKELSFTAIETPHDADGSVCYFFTDGRARAALVTDLGYVPEAIGVRLAALDALILEANHDPDRLWGGPYPYPLKRRIAGDEGHLSNGAAAEAACRAVSGGARQVVLAHLSRENNLPELAVGAVRSAAAELGAVAGRDFCLSVAPRFEACAPWEV